MLVPRSLTSVPVVVQRHGDSPAQLMTQCVVLQSCLNVGKESSASVYLRGRPGRVPILSSEPCNSFLLPPTPPDSLPCPNPNLDPTSYFHRNCPRSNRSMFPRSLMNWDVKTKFQSVFNFTVPVDCNSLQRASSAPLWLKVYGSINRTEGPWTESLHWAHLTPKTLSICPVIVDLSLC